MSFAYMPLYTGDYLRDTRHLTPLRHGIYMLALMHCWDSKGPMPLDEQEAAGICNCRSADEVHALRYIIDRYFVRMDDGHYNKRMADEVLRFENIAGSRREGGLRSAQVRRDKAAAGTVAKRVAKDGQTSDELKFNSSSAQVKHDLVTPSPSPSPSPSPIQIPIDASHLVQQPSQATLVAPDVHEDAPSPKKRGYVVPDCPYDDIVQAFHDACPTLPRVEIVSASRRDAMRARWREVCASDQFDRKAGIEWFAWFYATVGKSKFLLGKANPKPGQNAWRASFDWLLKPANFIKVIEGTYQGD